MNSEPVSTTTKSRNGFLKRMETLNNRTTKVCNLCDQEKGLEHFQQLRAQCDPCFTEKERIRNKNRVRNPKKPKAPKVIDPLAYQKYIRSQGSNINLFSSNPKR